MSSPSHLAPCPRPPCPRPTPAPVPPHAPNQGHSQGMAQPEAASRPSVASGLSRCLRALLRRLSKFAPFAPCRRRRQALPRSRSLRSHLNRVPNLHRLVLVTCEDLTAVGMRWARNNPLMVSQTTMNVVHNIYGAIIDLKRCFQLFSAKFLEIIVLVLDCFDEYIGFKFCWIWGSLQGLLR